MSPKPDSPSPRSGNPARQQTVKEQRAAQRQAKVEAYKQEQAKKARNRKIGIASAIVGGVAVIALLIVSIVITMPAPSATYEAGADDIEIEGVETFSNTNQHTEDPVEYEQNPPAGGDHNPAWLNCGIYTEVQANENAVHSLEHGAVWVTYDPAEVSDDELNTLKALLPSTYVILSPYEDMDTPIALSAWNAQLKVDDADDERIAQFFEAYWKSEKVPEPGASCVGAVDGPGKA
ncbi:DUF3105 domain-containing protein [Okibacterium endophyticum]